MTTVSSCSLLPKTELMDKLKGLYGIIEDASMLMLNIAALISHFEVDHSDSVKSWLDWCESTGKVRKGHPLRVQEKDVPPGILPLHHHGQICDVKVQSKGPDDAVYSQNLDILRKVARGNSVLKITHDWKEQLDVTIFAMRKFFDSRNEEYFLQPVEHTKSIAVMEKENGEAAHLAVRYIGDRFLIIAGSKNVHIIIGSRDDIEKYTDDRYLVAKRIAVAMMDELESLGDSEKLSLLLTFMALSKLTAVFEILFPSYQHVVDLSGLEGPKLKFLCWTLHPEICPDFASSSHTALRPDLGIGLAKYLGLDPTTCKVISIEDKEDTLKSIRRGYQSEGSVLYHMDASGNVIGLLKYKTAWYALARAIREKSTQAYGILKKTPNAPVLALDGEFMSKVTKRIDELAVPFGVDAKEIELWKDLASGFVTWSIGHWNKQGNEAQTRGTFPQMWKAFLSETGKSDQWNRK